MQGYDKTVIIVDIKEMCLLIANVAWIQVQQSIYATKARLEHEPKLHTVLKNKKRNTILHFIQALLRSLLS